MDGHVHVTFAHIYNKTWGGGGGGSESGGILALYKILLIPICTHTQSATTYVCSPVL